MVFRTIGMLSSISNVIIYYYVQCLLKKKITFEIFDIFGFFSSF